MKKDKISVIVPCYNVEKYVSRCLESLINQTYDNLEIILIEDCSKDNTLSILNDYLKKDSRIRLIRNDKNSGLSFSRNVGIKNATGDYIGFIDSDDYVSNDFYEKLVGAITKETADISICDIKIVYEKNKTEVLSKCYSGNEFNLLNVINTGLAASACNKLFKKSVFDKYLFAEGKVNEDVAVVLPALVNANSIAYANKTYYYYVQRENSIQNSSFSDKRFDIFYGVDTTLDRIKKHKNFEKIKDAIIFNQIIVLLIYVIPKETDIKKRKWILKKFDKLSRKYYIRKNVFFWKFLEKSGKKHRLYYKTLFKLNCTGHYNLSNMLVESFNCLNKVYKKTVIDKNINLEKVIDSARFQSSLKDEKIKLSVVIPNYNYARFMYQRIYSILSQNYKIYELIILDDNSSDNSIEIINKIVSKIDKYVNIKVIYNVENSGSAFKQWKKGFENANGDYVWIAEADDYCKKSLIRNLIKPIKNNGNIVISYCDTAFINVDGNIIIKSINDEIDVQKTKHWKRNYINNGMSEIHKYSFLNNTIANVSSCIIRNGDYSKYLKEAGKYKQAGDWLFYVELMTNGDVAYNCKALNFYRLHGNNVSSVMDHQKHLDELKMIYEYYDEKFNLNKEQKKKIQKRIKFLRKVWGLKK